jgi:hypothetical protein
LLLTLRPSFNDHKNTDFANTDPEKQTLFYFAFAACSNEFFLFEMQGLFSGFLVFRVGESSGGNEP